MFYKLDENKKVVPSSLEDFSTFMEVSLPTNYRHVGDDTIDGKRISTVFIGLCVDINLTSRLPNVFETMVFDENEHGIYQRRYPTWEEAELGHQRALQWVREEC